MADTGAAKLPGLPALQSADKALQRWADAVAEHLEVRAGARGNPAERCVTQRELLAATKGLDYLRSEKSTTINAGDMVLNLGGGLTVSVAIDTFAQSIFNGPLAGNLLKRLNDQSRFDNVPEQVKQIVLHSIAEEAAQRGADIVRLEHKLQTGLQSLAYTVEEVTASVAGAAAGVRETTYALASANTAQAGKITQIESSLGSYYQDGTEGRASLEQTLITEADRVDGLSAEYMVKVQAGGIFGGFGLSAISPVDPAKPAYSAALFAVDRFSIVFPEPANETEAQKLARAGAKRIPFGIDANGIYMHSDVYVKGNMRVDTLGRRLQDGLRGSLQISLAGLAWNDEAASTGIWQALGNAGAPANANHLVIGDSVTFAGNMPGTGEPYSETRQWMGSSWIVPGIVINGDMLLDGALSAQKIDTRGLTIRDELGNIIFGSGAASVAASFAHLGLKSLATKDTVNIGEHVRMPTGLVDGVMQYQTLGVLDFVNSLSKITSDNIVNFMGPTAITSAYIGNAAVGTLKIGSNAVTVPASGSSGVGSVPSCTLYMAEPGTVYVTGSLWMLETSGSDGGAVTAVYSARIDASNGASGGYCINHSARARHSTITTAYRVDVLAGWHTFTMNYTTIDGTYQPQGGSIMATGTMR